MGPRFGHGRDDIFTFLLSSVKKKNNRYQVPLHQCYHYALFVLVSCTSTFKHKSQPRINIFTSTRQGSKSACCDCCYWQGKYRLPRQCSDEVMLIIFRSRETRSRPIEMPTNKRTYDETLPYHTASFRRLPRGFSLQSGDNTVDPREKIVSDARPRHLGIASEPIRQIGGTHCHEFKCMSSFPSTMPPRQAVQVEHGHRLQAVGLACEPCWDRLLPKLLSGLALARLALFRPSRRCRGQAF